MRRLEGLFANWLDISIASLLERRASVVTAFDFVLITSIDSIVNLGATLIARDIVVRYPSSYFLGGGLLTTGGAVGQVAQERAPFTGFDELWCFDTKPIVAKPIGLSIASPLQLAKDDVPSLLPSWMLASKCQLGLGDGIGMNYVTPGKALAHTLESLGS